MLKKKTIDINDLMNKKKGRKIIDFPKLDFETWWLLRNLETSGFSVTLLMMSQVWQIYHQAFSEIPVRKKVKKKSEPGKNDVLRYFVTQMQIMEV